MILVLYTVLVQTVLSWPDGAPCIHSAYESMNPLEAVEHQGGLQLTVPPYDIRVDHKCYWRNQPISLHLQGVNQSVWFKGFAIQPFEWNNGRLGGRMGQLMRLDDNGSWQQQCFRFKDSATHSHDEKKRHLRFWWKVDEDSRTVQFVATVVKHRTMFWVKSVLSNPIPPCRILKNGIENYKRPLPTLPPPVKQFKMETNKIFGNDRFMPLPEETSIQTTTISPTFNNRIINTAQLSFINRIITTTQSPFLTQSTPTNRKNETTATTTTMATTTTTMMTTAMAPTTTRTAATTRFVPLIFNRTRKITIFPPRRRLIHTRPQTVSTTSRTLSRQPDNELILRSIARANRPPQRIVFCYDRDGTERCMNWISHCRTERFYIYMWSYCARTCGYCGSH
ncbi:hypothetical protein KIN20_002036 [Parelaphostrongylus tenuis]|uniref:ShKT domain-containing protein n=1 Tax=Parelaphostrongylus tenuis TaxID=148309 RepID=A0AAD5QGI8_PARTN|nr:hypothetical protein KIN20_002036 [Parelaphostrongylus tenuis]